MYRFKQLRQVFSKLTGKSQKLLIYLKMPVISKSYSDNYRPISVSLSVYTLFYNNNFIKTKRLKFAQELRTS